MSNFSAARKNMVDCQVQTAGVTVPAILDAFGTVPRETFAPQGLQNIAYNDEDLPLGGGRYMPEPITHSKMVQAVEPSKDQSVLDIGGGTGYPAAIMAKLVRKVTALEEGQFLDYASQVWAHLGLNNITPAAGKLVTGSGQNAPYDIIFINGAVNEIPVHLTQQLVPGGRLIALVKKPGAVMGQVTLVRNSVGDKFSSRVLFEAGGHYLPGFEPQPTFVFNN
jgi:protein-L-isoaspartate(D-aspartate) O-methyltransferase